MTAENLPDDLGNLSYQDEFITTLAPRALKLHKQYNILPSLQIGMGAKESGWGGKSKPSRLVLEFNNLYGTADEPKESHNERSEKQKYTANQ